MRNFDNHLSRLASVVDLDNPDRLNIYKKSGQTHFLIFFGSRRALFFMAKIL